MRKAFECVLCEGIYADAPVSECDCASKANVFSEGVILSADEWESLRSDAERYRWLADNDQLDPRYQHEALTIAFSDLAGGALDGVVDSIIRQHEANRSPENP